MSYELNDVEKANLEKWVSKRAIKAALKKGAELSLTFSNSSGIGRSVTATLDLGVHPDDMVIYPRAEQDITDYGSW